MYIYIYHIYIMGFIKQVTTGTYSVCGNPELFSPVSVFPGDFLGTFPRSLKQGCKKCTHPPVQKSSDILCI